MAMLSDLLHGTGARGGRPEKMPGETRNFEESAS
jgi:hypothetical protein